MEQIEEQYRLIEVDSQKQFNDYVIKLRDDYRSKVTTFKHVIESQQKVRDLTTDSANLIGCTNSTQFYPKHAR